MIPSVVLSLLSIAFLSTMIFKQAKDIITERVLSDLNNRIDSTSLAIETAYETNLKRQKSIMQSLAPEILPGLTLSETEVSRFDAVDQITKEKVTVEIPKLLYQENSLENHDLVERIGKYTSETATVFQVIPNGLLRVSTNIRKLDGTRAVGTYIPSSSPVYKTVMSGKTFFGRAFVVNAWYVTAYKPFKDAAGKIIGVLYVGSKETTSAKIKEYLSKVKILETGYIYILDSKGVMQLHPTLTGKNVFEAKDASGSFLFKKLIKMKNGSLKYFWPLKDGSGKKEKLTIFKYYPDMDWIVSASLDQDRVLREVNEMQGKVIVLGVICILIIGVFFWFLGNKLSQAMIDYSNDVNSKMHEVGDTSYQVSLISKDLSKISNSQLTHVEQTSSAADELDVTVQKNRKMAEDTQKVAEEDYQKSLMGQKEAENIKKIIQDMGKTNSEITQEMIQTANDMRKMGDKINEISAKTNVINDIVFQTRLLSFNASVEAARAGEHGKGFAVVAEEVGNLASMSGLAASEIEAMLKSNIEFIVSTIDHNEKRLEALTKESKDKIKSSLESTEQSSRFILELSDSAKNMRQVLAELVSSTNEQAIGIESIIEAIRGMSNEAKSTQIKSMDVQKISDKLMESSSEAKEKLDLLKSTIVGDQPSAEESFTKPSIAENDIDDDRSGYSKVA